jgi:general secretion pathway protein B
MRAIVARRRRETCRDSDPVSRKHMSLILEALKKSEQQRRLGEAPTLGSPVVATRRRRHLLPIFAILIVAAAGAAWWLWRPSHAPAPPASAPTVAESTRPAHPNATPPAKPAARPPAAPMPGTSAQDRRAKLLEEAAARRAEQAKRAANMPHPPAQAAAQNPKTTAPATASAGTQKSVTTSAAPVSPTAPGHVAATPAPPRTSAKTSAAPASPPPTAKPAAAAPALPTIWELPYSTRKDLPAIDLSMHVYSDDPAQRFVVIKGDRHVEGDELGQDLVLREIRRDGLVLEFKGQTFFFPRNGR